MGASRDYTSGNEFGDGHSLTTALAERPRAVSFAGARPAEHMRSATPRPATISRTGSYAAGKVDVLRERGYEEPSAPGRGLPPRRTSHTGTPQRGQRAQRLGSRQVVSERGRRVSSARQVSQRFRLASYGVGLLIAGVCGSMWFSGQATQQAFHIQELSVQETMLTNQLETLHRDLENVRSSADVARRAAEASMGVPVQAGIVEVQENGDIAERRPATAETESIIDVNGAPVRPGQASSDPKEVADVSGNLNAVPQGEQGIARPDPARRGQMPYAARTDR
ncbi:hypothetical protein [Corynebacterium lizhenjunii]|uniref:hypothetical protein n=1 Tax=Corynebacterium lizhenjunii TaxID=2709394 RepID=UPI001F174B54|nr:hypothetical protein [Corynebacterium lizhenjunii]